MTAARSAYSAAAAKWSTHKEPRHDDPFGKNLQRADRSEADGEVQLPERHAGAAPGQGHAQHGRGRSRREQEGPGERERRHDEDRGPEVRVDAAQEATR